VLHQLRQQAREALSSVRQIVLSTYGPAEIQAESLPCEAVGLALYVLVPTTSDLLFNLESDGHMVVATSDTWQLRGVAHVLSRGEYPSELSISRLPEAAWSELAEIRPTKLQLRPLVGQGATIDVW
jgi:hypothetical protein